VGLEQRERIAAAVTGERFIHGVQSLQRDSAAFSCM
jgi:hypothetical protein